MLFLTYVDDLTWINYNICGTHEMFYQDIIKFFDKLKKISELNIGEDMAHVYPIYRWFRFKGCIHYALIKRVFFSNDSLI